MNQAYHLPCSHKTMYDNFTNQVDVDYSKLKGANVLIGMFNAVYILAKVDYPSKVVKTYFSDKDVVVDIQIEQLFQITQDERCLLWTEL